MEVFLASLTDPSQRLFLLSVVTAFVLAIALVVVIFISQIRHLKNRLIDAKELDDSKNSKISTLLKKMEEIQSKDDLLERELKQFNDTRASLQSKKELIFRMQERMDSLEEKERQYLETIESCSKEFQTLGYRYKGLKKRNEFLVEENSHFRVENTKTLMKVREQERRLFEKHISLQGNSTEQRREIETMIEGIIGKNQKIFASLEHEVIMTEISPLSEDILEYQREIIASFKNSLEREHDLRDELLKQYESRERAGEKIETILEKLKEDHRVAYAGSEVMQSLLKVSGIEKRNISYVREEGKESESGAVDTAVKIVLPNGQVLVVDLAFPLESYEIYHSTLEPAKRNESLKGYLDAVRSYMDGLFEEIPGKVSNRRICWVLVPSTDALQTLCAHDGALCAKAEERALVLLRPLELMDALEKIALLWRYRQHYDLATRLIAKAEEIEERFIEYGEEISEVAQHLEMIQGSLTDKKTNKGV